MLIEVLRDSVQIHPKGIKFQQEQINCRISRRLKWKQVKIPSFFISLIIRINKATKSLFRTFKSQSISYQFILWLKNTNQSDEGKRITSLYLTWIAQATFWVWETLWTLHHFLHTFSDFHLKYLEVEDQQKHQLEIKLKDNEHYHSIYWETQPEVIQDQVLILSQRSPREFPLELENQKFQYYY